MLLDACEHFQPTKTWSKFQIKIQRNIYCIVCVFCCFIRAHLFYIYFYLILTRAASERAEDPHTHTHISHIALLNAEFHIFAKQPCNCSIHPRVGIPCICVTRRWPVNEPNRTMCTAYTVHYAVTATDSFCWSALLLPRSQEDASRDHVSYCVYITARASSILSTHS